MLKDGDECVLAAGPTTFRELRPARLQLVRHGWRGRVPRLVDRARYARAGRRRRNRPDIERRFISAEVVAYHALTGRGAMAA
jgi:hypothetical protein